MSFIRPKPWPDYLLQKQNSLNAFGGPHNINDYVAEDSTIAQFTNLKDKTKLGYKKLEKT